MSEKTGNLSIYILFALLIVLTLGQKRNLHVDEVYSYGLANHADGPVMSIEEGLTYYPAATPWIEYMTVDRAHRFDYGIVWQNQAQDAHPPLYYAFLHTICSCMPGIFTIWAAGLINILFAMGVLFFFRKLVLLLTNDAAIQRLISLGFVCSAGILSFTSFLRMYIMAMFWVTAAAYLLVSRIDRAHTKRFYLAIFLCTLGGGLTHYYCIVYTVFASAVYLGCLLYGKRRREAGGFCLVQGAAALGVLAIFPPILRQIFSGSRGEESMANMAGTSLTDWLAGIGTFFDIMDRQLFGGLFLYLLIAALFFLFARGCAGEDRRGEERDSVMRWLCLVLPPALYFVLVARIAIYQEGRYISPIYAIVFGAVLCGVSLWIRTAGRSALCLTALAVSVFTVSGWKNAEWDYLYRDSGELLDAAADYADVDCVMVYRKPWQPNPAYLEARQYHSVTFLRENELDQPALTDAAAYGRLILMVTEDDESAPAEDCLEEVMDRCPQLNACEYIGEYVYTKTYYLFHREE